MAGYTYTLVIQILCWMSLYMPSYGSVSDDLRVSGGGIDDVTVAGYAQIYRLGAWYTLCDQGWSDLDANVFCNQQGYDRGVPHLTPYSVPEPPEPIWKNEITCSKSSQTLAECNNRTVVIKCKPAGVICDHRNPNLVDGTIRLVDGPTPYSGRLTVAYQGLWGSVCDRMWDQTSASAVCGMLGYEEGGMAVTHSVFGYPRQVFLDAVQCTEGSETSIIQCMNPAYDFMNQFCSMTRTAGVLCYQEQYANLTGEVRLNSGDGVGGQEGYIEVNFYGVWGTICYKDWDDKASRVACRQMGYETGTRSKKNFPPVYSPSWLRHVVCEGNETALTDCDLASWAFITCFEEDVKLHCHDKHSVSDPDDTLTKNILLYTLPAVFALLTIVVVAIIVYRRKTVNINNIILDDKNSPANKQNMLDTKNPAYNQNVYMPAYLQSQYYRRTSGVYNDITYDDMAPTYLDLIDDVGGLVRSADDHRELEPRVAEPLPRVPLPEDEYLHPTDITNVESEYLHTCSLDDGTYITTTGLKDKSEKHIYVNNGQSNDTGDTYLTMKSVDEPCDEHTYANEGKPEEPV